MAKATQTGSRSKAVEPTEIHVRYELNDLPTAYHKAGVAGLVMLLQSLEQRRLLKHGEVQYEVNSASVAITFTETLVQRLFDDLYDAKIVEVAVKAKWAGAEIARAPTDAEREAGTPYVYRVVQPVGQFLRDSFPEMPEDRSWLKLWRDMIWNVIRGRPTTREPYNQRALEQPCKEATSAWRDLLRVFKSRAKGEFATGELSSALLPGAQAVNAECVPFHGRLEENLLLHFWPLAVLLFVPQEIARDGTTSFAGYALAIPDVSDLRNFVDDFRVLLASLNGDLSTAQAVRGFRPTMSIVDLPAEGALALMEYLASVTTQQVEAGALRHSISAVEYLHLVKLGNNIKTMAAGRVSPNSKLLRDYHDLTSPDKGRPRFRNPLFRRGLLLAILADVPWYHPFSRVFQLFDASLFLRSSRREQSSEGQGVPSFGHDAFQRLQMETQQFTIKMKRNESMSAAEKSRESAPLPMIVNRIVRSYIMARTQEKSGITLNDFETDDKVNWANVPPVFHDTKAKIAQSLMYEFRSRKDQAFIDHFAAVFFSVTQRITEADRLGLADALTNVDRRDDLKTLTLLSISANS